MNFHHFCHRKSCLNFAKKKTILLRPHPFARKLLTFRNICKILYPCWWHWDNNTGQRWHRPFILLDKLWALLTGQVTHGRIYLGVSLKIDNKLIILPWQISLFFLQKRVMWYLFMRATFTFTIDWIWPSLQERPKYTYIIYTTIQ